MRARNPSIERAVGDGSRFCDRDDFTALIIGIGGLLVASGDLVVGSTSPSLRSCHCSLVRWTTWVNAGSTVQEARAWVNRLDDLLKQTD